MGGGRRHGHDQKDHGGEKRQDVEGCFAPVFPFACPRIRCIVPTVAHRLARCLHSVCVPHVRPLSPLRVGGKRTPSILHAGGEKAAEPCARPEQTLHPR